MRPVSSAVVSGTTERGRKLVQGLNGAVVSASAERSQVRTEPRARLGDVGCYDHAMRAGFWLLWLPLLGCGDDDAVRSTGSGLCARCIENDDICADGCIDYAGQTSVECYAKQDGPYAWEYSCDDLIYCSPASVCFYKKPMGDGCYEHRCIPPPPECANDVTCGCLQQYTTSPCTTKNGGPYIQRTNSDVWDL